MSSESVFVVNEFNISIEDHTSRNYISIHKNLNTALTEFYGILYEQYFLKISEYKTSDPDKIDEHACMFDTIEDKDLKLKWLMEFLEDYKKSIDLYDKREGVVFKAASFTEDGEGIPPFKSTYFDWWKLDIYETKEPIKLIFTTGGEGGGGGVTLTYENINTH